MADGKNTSALIDFAAVIAKNIAKDASIPATTHNIPEIKSAVIDAAQDVPEIRNAFNMEGLAQSRVMVGLVISAVGTILAAFDIQFADGDVQKWTDAGTAALALGGLAVAAYGRIRGSKLPPLTFFGLLKG